MVAILHRACAAGIVIGCAMLSPAPAAERIGVCPASAPRTDAYVQLLCEGETQLAAGRNSEALERFRIAATVGRLDASNELAWAGLAAAHCRRGELKQGREWAEYFAQARRLWLGDLSCSSADAGQPGALLPYVQSRMCTDTLKADYELIRARPLSPTALDLSARLKIVADRVEHDCTTNADAGATHKPAAQPSSAKSSAKTSSRKKRRKSSAKR